MMQFLKINCDKSTYKLVLLLTLALLMQASFTANANAEGTSRIVKWKDDKGVTHYSDSIPAQYANHENSVINQQGVTVKRKKPVNHQEEALNQTKLGQDKKDKALLGAFTNENEIDLARDRNLQADQAALENLQLEKSHSQKHLAENQKYADSLTRMNKPIPADLSADIKTNQAKIAKHDQQISERNAMMESTRKRFEEDKKRYIELKPRTNVNNTLAETPLGNKP